MSAGAGHSWRAGLAAGVAAFRSVVGGSKRAPGADPTVSVIIPFRDVDAYFADCLSSVAAQGGASLQVVLIDDGSVDGSRKIADDFARSHPSTVVLDSPGTGPGAARNAGLRAATGEFLTFVDSDDLLAENAIRRLLASARSNGADVVVGAVERFTSERAWNPRWVREVHAEQRLGIRAEDFPPIVRNNYGWNKLYRASYWRAQDLWFVDDDVIFQDQPLVARLLWRAGRINVLDSVVYRYRQRDDRSSISQRPEEFRSLRDRIAAWERTVTAIAEDSPSPRLVEAWYRTLLETHFHWYLSSETIGDPEYWRLLREEYLRLSAMMPRHLLTELSAQKRIPLLLLEADAREEAAALQHQSGLVANDQEGALRTARHEPGSPAFDIASYEGDAFATPLTAMAVDAWVARGAWTGTSSVRGLSLTVGVRCATPLPPETVVRLVVRDGTHDLATIPCTPAPDADRALMEQQYRLQLASTLDLDVSALTGSSASVGVLSLWVEVCAGGAVSRQPITRMLAAGGAAELSSTSIGASGELRLVRGPHGQAPVRLRSIVPKARVLSVAVTDRVVSFSVQVDAATTIRSVTLVGQGEGRVEAVHAAARDGRIVVEATLPAADAGAPARSWSVEALDAAGRRVPMRWPDGRSAPTVGVSAAGAIVALSSAAGELKFEDFPFGVVRIDEVRDGAIVAASEFLPSGTSLVPDGIEVGVPVDATAHEVIATVALADGTRRSVPVVASQGVIDTLPQPWGEAGALERRRPRGLTICASPARTTVGPERHVPPGSTSPTPPQP